MISSFLLSKRVYRKYARIRNETKLLKVCETGERESVYQENGFYDMKNQSFSAFYLMNICGYQKTESRGRRALILWHWHCGYN